MPTLAELDSPLRSFMESIFELNTASPNMDAIGRKLAEFARDLDRRNPQAAARMMSAFRSWRALEPGRRAHAEATLRRLAAESDLSVDMRDIVDRCLQ